MTYQEPRVQQAGTVTPPRPRRHRRRSRGVLAGAVIGVLSAAVALGIAELVSAFFRPQASPVIGIGENAIDQTPPALKNFAVQNFGSNDKLVLLSGIYAVIAIIAMIIGVVARRWLVAGMIGIALFGAVGAVAEVTRPTARTTDMVPSLVGAVVGIAALAILVRSSIRRVRYSPADTVAQTPEQNFWDPYPRSAPRAPSPSGPATVDRRRFVLTSAAAAVTAASAGAAGSLLLDERFSVANSRAAVKLSPPAKVPMVTGNVDMKIPGLSPFYTQNKKFYRVDDALTLPTVAADAWSLRIHGMVKNEIRLSFAELMRRPMIERDITLTCVSDSVGGPYIGNARWQGIRLAALLREAGVDPRADQIVSRSSDGFSIGTPTAVVMDGRDAMLAVGMNGEPLPAEHGFPVRMVVPGLYGYVSACKWIVDMELTTFGAYNAYWVQRGWSQQAMIKTESRIDTPRDGKKLAGGTVTIAGVAWAQHRGIKAVDVRIDGGSWQRAQLAGQDTIDTWRQWALNWAATPGTHKLEVRATDRTGAAQTEAQAPPEPNGATGFHTINVTVA
jgi:DMSO/TMAO reductase YedYZ molybdopterin-dependent catalytic subunit